MRLALQSTAFFVAAFAAAALTWGIVAGVVYVIVTYT